MLNPFQQPELIKAELFMSMPKKFRDRRRTAWSDPNRQGAEVECFLEGPSFDRDGTISRFPRRHRARARSSMARGSSTRRAAVLANARLVDLDP